MTKLIPQDYRQPEDKKGSRKKNTPQDLASGTYFGQMQLRGSILVIKDNSTTASGFISFGTSMSTIPTTSASGTGIYLDYSIIAGLSSGTKQFYLQASDGKAYAGAGAVTLDVNGIYLNENTKIRFWRSSDNTRFWDFYNDLSASATNVNLLSDFTSAVKQFSIVGSYGTSFDSTFSVIAGSSAGTTSITLTAREIGVSTTALSVTPTYVNIASTAPQFRMQDTTASAKSLLMTTDANVTTIKEVSGSTFFTWDLANAQTKLDGHLIFTDATYDIGASGATRPRDLFLSRKAVLGSTLALGGAASGTWTQKVISSLANLGVAQVGTAAADTEFIIVVCNTTGTSAGFALSGGVHTTGEAFDPYAAYSVTAGTAGTNVYWSAGNSRYEIENRTGGTATYTVFEMVV